MKLNILKQPGGVLSPADDIAAEYLTKLKTGEVYPVEIKRSRNPHHHKKVFAFFQFAFNYWRGECEFQEEAAQFDSFRKQLTIQAGYYNQVWTLDGQGFTLEAKSLSYGNMSQTEFEEFAVAMQNAAMATIFQGANERVIQELMSFF